MFNCGVKYNSQLAIIDKGIWKNGYVLSQDQSLFLCQFLARLINNFKKIASTFDEASYHKAIENTLLQTTLDDITKFGSVRGIMTYLAHVCAEPNLSSNAMALLYAKDFAKIRKVDEADIAINVLQCPPTQNEIVQVIMNRDEQAIINPISLFIRGDKRLVSQLSQLTEAIN